MNTTYTAKIGCINTGTTPSAQVTLNGTEFIFNFTLPKEIREKKEIREMMDLTAERGNKVILDMLFLQVVLRVKY